MIIGQSRKFSGVGAHAAAFLARTSGLDGTHTTAYTDLINGLDTDGLFSKLDVLHIYATQDSATALLNLVSTSFNGTAHGSPTFTADRGFTGVLSSSTVYIDTGFNPSVGSPQYTVNSAHLSVWNLTNAATSALSIGAADSSNEWSYLLSKFTDNEFYMRVNNTSQVPGDGGAIGDPRGHLIGNRSNSSSLQAYQNGSSLFTNGASSSGAINNRNFYTLGANNAGTASGDGRQFAAASIGASWNSTEALNFYNRLRTYMTAVGVP